MTEAGNHDFLDLEILTSRTAVRQMLTNIDSDLTLYICIQHQFTGFTLMTKRLRPNVIMHGSGYKRKNKL